MNEIEYLIHCVKFEIWPALYYINSLSYFHQWNPNCDIAFLTSSIDLKLQFLKVGLRGMTSTKRGKAGHKILGNFADSCGCFFGRACFSDSDDDHKYRK